MTKHVYRLISDMRKKQAVAYQLFVSLINAIGVDMILYTEIKCNLIKTCLKYYGKFIQEKKPLSAIN